MGLFRSKNAEKDTSPDSKGTSGSKEPAPAAPSSDTQNASKTGHYRPIFLLAWESALFKAHWAVFVPNASDKTCKTGKYIHVVGNLEKGFEFEVVRGWDINMSRHRPLSPIEIGWVRVELVEDTPTVKGQLAKEAVPRDQLEAILASVAPPSKSLKSASSSEPSAVRKTSIKPQYLAVTKMSCLR